jgi:hypothetical protein
MKAEIPIFLNLGKILSGYESVLKAESLKDKRLQG